MKTNTIISVLVLFVCIQFALMVNASAYLDPSAMTYAIQILAGVIIAGGAAIAIYWRKIKLFFKKRKQRRNSSSKPKDVD